jgi:gliding motility-associated-like protein
VKGPISLHAMPGGSEYQYYWTGPAGFTSTAQSPFVDSPGAANQGEYYLVVTNSTTGCASKDSIPVTLAQDIAEELTHVTQSTTIKLGESVQLNADSALYFSWYPDNGSLSNTNINDPVARPMVSTTYYVVGINQYGCRDTDSVHVEVLFDPIFIPSAFSPNKDGLNDVFRVGNLGYYTLVQMSVYDRWGELVYEDNSGSDGGWDGTYKGKPMDMGTFFYYIIVRRPDEKQITYKGDLTLLR